MVLLYSYLLSFYDDGCLSTAKDIIYDLAFQDKSVIRSKADWGNFDRRQLTC